MQLGELSAQQRISRTEQHLTVCRYLAVVAGRHVGEMILIEQQVAIVAAIGNVIDAGDLTGGGPQHRFPFGIERVMIDDEPIPEAI